MLKAGKNGRGDSGDKTLSKPELKKNPLKDMRKADVIISDSELSDSNYDPLSRTIQNRSNALTQMSREESEHVPKRSPPKKNNVVKYALI